MFQNNPSLAIHLVLAVTYVARQTRISQTILISESYQPLLALPASLCPHPHPRHVFGCEEAVRAQGRQTFGRRDLRLGSAPQGTQQRQRWCAVHGDTQGEAHPEDEREPVRAHWGGHDHILLDGGLGFVLKAKLQSISDDDARPSGGSSLHYLCPGGRSHDQLQEQSLALIGVSS
eukprot:TCALIF_05584-PA protein Name:"Protein of unknown function" AED:0.02 eAED:0.02 QI:3/1/1/1/1/1/2/360/174